MTLNLHEHKRELLIRALEQTGGNRTHTAKRLGVCIRTVRNLIEQFSLGHLFPSSTTKFKTHCLRGHEFTAANIIRMSNGHRMCRGCYRLRLKARNVKRRRLKE